MHGVFRRMLRDTAFSPRRTKPYLFKCSKSLMDLATSLNAAAEIATALGLAFTGVQLWRGHRQSVTDFEDTLAAEYRQLATTLPPKALLGEKLTSAEQQKALKVFYHYFDLSNSQVYLRKIGRVSPRTFAFWRDGIKAHLQRPAFIRAWDEISSKVPNDFFELRRLIDEEYEIDPKTWR